MIEQELQEKYDDWYNIGYDEGIKEGLEKRYDHDFIEKVIDAYLLVKHECQNKDYIERHDFITMVINKTKSI